MKYLSTLWAALLLVANSGCDSQAPSVTNGAAGGGTGLGNIGGSSATGGTACDWGDAGVTADAPVIPTDAGSSDLPPGTCALMNAAAPLHSTLETDSPCPVEAPSIVGDTQSRACDRSLLGTRCVYPSTISSDVEDIWTCVEAGGTYDASGNLVAGSTVTSWESQLSVCRRTGRNCLIGLDEVCGHTSPRIALTTSCAERTVVACEVLSDETAQTNLDHTLRIPESCYSGAGLTRAALSVWFNGDCPSSFIVYPPEVADCVKAYLETVRFDCAAGLVCGATGMTGGCLC